MADNFCAMQNEHIADIAMLKTDMADVKSKVFDLSDMKEVLIRLEILQTNQEKLNTQRATRDEKFDKMYEQQLVTNLQVSSSLEKINENLTGMNTSIKKTNERINDVEEFIRVRTDEDKEREKEKEIEAIKKTSFDFVDLIKTKVIPYLLSGGLVYAIVEIVKNIKM